MIKPFDIEANVNGEVKVVTIDPEADLSLTPSEFSAVQQFMIDAAEASQDEDLIAAGVAVFIQLRRALGDLDGLAEAVIEDLIVNG